MHDMYENQVMPVLLALGVFILVLAYCRLTVGDAKPGRPPSSSPSPRQETAGAATVP
jgi:cytochrome b561